MFTEELKKIHIKTAEDMLYAFTLIYCANNFYSYEKGVYRLTPKGELTKYIRNLLDDNFSSHRLRETLCYLQSKTYLDIEALNNSDLLNVKNGLLDLQGFTLRPHSSDTYSTIQLPVSYNPQAKCPKWLQTLNEIFEEDQQKIQILQEFFGLCFTRVVKYEKALFLIGEGANGKSVLLSVLQHILGKGNYSVIPLEKFDRGPYVVNLFGKLANISIETNAKSSVYDSIFKAVISGDEIPADAKFEQTINFRPFCKLIFALNNMPRVDDKTSAFFRRLLIIRFNRIFRSDEQNKTLKFELFEEVDGIFNWCLEGLKKLETSGDFEPSQEMRQEVEEYRMENNNVLIFVEEKCLLGANRISPKDELYGNYSQWCKDHGNFPLQMIKFGKELRKQFPSIIDDRTSTIRCWRGIQFNRG
jgi:putative DNA primase/helicase